MIGNLLRRVALVTVCVPAVWLAACGGGTTVGALTPTRLVSFGDAFSDIGNGGTTSKYTVNDATVNTWVEQLATGYQLTITPSATGGLGYARGNARITGKPDAAGQAAKLTVPEIQEKVTEAAARIATDYKNAQIMDAINAVTFGTKHTIAADTQGTTFDLKLYNTIRKARKKLGTLVHPLYANRLVSTLAGFNAPGLLVHPNNLWDLQRVLSGFTAGGFVQDVAPLPIGDMIPYACGIQHGEVWGEETLSLPGVTENKAYMFIPDQAIIVDKRDVTLEVGSGSVLELSAEERSWHRISGTHTNYLIGGADTSNGATGTGKGCILEINLPTE